MNLKQFKTHKMRDKRFKILFKKPPRIKKEELDGLCDIEKKTIFIDPTLEAEREMNITIHETLHACFPDIEEGAVTETAACLSELLWKLNYRKNN
jgi:hypothetical protein